MKRTLLAIMSLLLILTAKAQLTDSARNSNETIFTSVQQVPEYPGGLRKLYDFLEANIRYPVAAREINTQGAVIVSMVVEKDGSLSQVKVQRGIGDGCDEEAIRVVKLTSPWKPGMQNSRTVRVAYTLPVNFRLAKAQKSDTVTITRGDSTYTLVEIPPSFPGGMKEFYKYLVKTVRYPATARENNTQGKVVVSVMIEKDGSVSDAKVVRSVSKDLDDEALRVVKLSPKWLPGTQNEKPARMAYSLPISFTLAN